MSIEEMVNDLEQFLEESGLEYAKEKYLDSKSDEEIEILYEAIFNSRK